MFHQGRVRFGLRRTTTIAALMLAVSLGACASKKAGAPFSTGSTEPITREAALANAQGLNDEYRKKPDDPAVALRFAESLKIIGSEAQAVAVLAAAAGKHTGNAKVVSAYGKSLMSVGRVTEAVEVLKRAETLAPGDWRIATALGLAHDQSDRHDVARSYYARAAKAAPGEPSILNNWGLSFALDRDLPNAEKVLRKASGMRGAEPRIRQNLALVVGLQGRFEEAEKIARMDLPPAEAEENIAYLRAMLAEPNAWNQLARIDAGKTGAPKATGSTKPRLKAPATTGN